RALARNSHSEWRNGFMADFFLLFVCWLPFALPVAAEVPGGAQQGQDSRSAVEASPEKIRSLIEQLRSPRFSERESAINNLRRIGVPALPAIWETAGGNADLETRRRADIVERAILKDMSDRILKETREQIGRKDYAKAAEDLERAINRCELNSNK